MELVLSKNGICGDLLDALNDLDSVGRSAYPGYPADGRFGSSSAIFEFKNKMTGIVHLTVNQGGLQRCNIDSRDKKTFKKALSVIAGGNYPISNQFTGQISLEYAQGILQKAVFIEKK